jgi:tetratricopeptide (TPR) repeat protein
MTRTPSFKQAGAAVDAAVKVYGESGRLKDLDTVIAALESLVAVAPQEEATHGMTVMRLAEALGTRWAKSRDDATWDRAVLLVSSWKARVPPPDWRAALYLLADGLLRYERANATEDPADVAAAIAALEAARGQVRAGSGVHSTSSVRLANLRLRRFEAEHAPVDLEAAIQDALAVLGSKRAKDGERFAAARDIARAFQLRYEWEQMADNLDAALAAAQEAATLAPTKADMGDIQGAMGTAYRSRYELTHDRRDLDAAITAYQRSIELGAGARAAVRGNRLDNLSNGFGDRYYLTGDPTDLDQAISYSKEALALQPPDDRERPRTWANLGSHMISRAVDRRDSAALDEAVHAFQRGLDLAPNDHEITSRLHFGLASALLIRNALADEALRKRASDLDDAIEHLTLALDQALQGEVSHPVLYRLGRLESTATVSRRLVGALLHRAETAGEGQMAGQDRRRALAVAEATKSPLLTEELLRRTLSPPTDAPAGLVDHEAALLAYRAALDVHELTPAEGTTSARRLHRMARRVQLASALEHVWEEYSTIGQLGAEYAALRRSPASALLRLLQEGPDVTILSMALADSVDAGGRFHTGLAVMVWAPAWDAPHVAFTLDGDPLADIHAQFVDQVPTDRGVQAVPETWWQDLARHLRDRGGPPGVTTVVSPTVTGAGLPWALLLERAGWGDGALPAVVVIPSLAVAVLPAPLPGSTWREVTDGREQLEPIAKRAGIDKLDQDIVDGLRLTIRVPTRPSGPPLVVGNPAGDLSAAGDEATEVARVLGVTPLLGQEATMKTVRAALADSPLIHIAAHATFDADDPMRSAIHLFDGDLTVSRVIGEWSTADLVVLSACEGATGAVVTGGEMLGVSSALLRAGADTVVASLWRVDDAASSYLMRTFHESLLAGASAAAALATAQARTRAESGWEGPYYWAGFLVSDRGAAL